MFSCPPQFRDSPDKVRVKYEGGDIWYGRVRLLYRIRVRTDADLDEDSEHTEQDLAMMECFEQFVDGTRDKRHIVLYQPEPEATVYVVPASDILGRISVVPYGDTGTIAYSMRSLRGAAFGTDARVDPPGGAGRGKGSALYHLNTWAMEWARDLHVKAAEPASEGEPEPTDDENDDDGGVNEDNSDASEEGSESDVGGGRGGGTGAAGNSGSESSESGLDSDSEDGSDSDVESDSDSGQSDSEPADEDSECESDSDGD